MKTVVIGTNGGRIQIAQNYATLIEALVDFVSYHDGMLGRPGVAFRLTFGSFIFDQVDLISFLKPVTDHEYSSQADIAYVLYFHAEREKKSDLGQSLLIEREQLQQHLQMIA